MVRHIVMWKLKEFAEGSPKAVNAGRIKGMLESLVGVVPQLASCSVGLNDLADPANYDAVLCSEFGSWEDLEAYKRHPEHVKVSEFVAKVRESRVAVDYEE
ncbi:MAG: Dabb family protein [Oscillospiraceae bacterium]|nr:Dabb family protein [Oscillospiraceae bacterium]